MITILLQKILDLLMEKLGLINTKSETGSGASVSFETDKELPLDSLTVEITAQQAGEGTPSPENVREISGFSSVVVTQKNGSDETVDTFTIALGDTYYGGVLDVINGTATITRAGYDLKNYTGNVVKVSAGEKTYFRFDDLEYFPLLATGYNFICDKYEKVQITSSNSTVGIGVGKASSVDHNSIFFRPNEPDSYTTTTIKDFIQNTLNGLFVVYDLETPITLTGLTTDNFTTINGVNVISANSGNVSVGYRISNEMATANKDISNDVTVNATDFSGVSYKVIRAGNVVMISLYGATVVHSTPAALFTGLPKPYNNVYVNLIDTVSNGIVAGSLTNNGSLGAAAAEADQRLSGLITYITKDEV